MAAGAGRGRSDLAPAGPPARMSRESMERLCPLDPAHLARYPGAPSRLPGVAAVPLTSMRRMGTARLVVARCTRRGGSASAVAICTQTRGASFAVERRTWRSTSL